MFDCSANTYVSVAFYFTNKKTLKPKQEKFRKHIEMTCSKWNDEQTRKLEQIMHSWNSVLVDFENKRESSELDGFCFLSIVCMYIWIIGYAICTLIFNLFSIRLVDNADDVKNGDERSRQVDNARNERNGYICVCVCVCVSRAHTTHAYSYRHIL